MRRLFFYVSRFRDAIEADLAFRGVSFGRLWRLRQWRKLLNLIQSLPPNSLFNEALWSDKETVVAMTEAMKNRQSSKDDRPPGPRVSQVSEEARRLGEVVSMLQWLGGVVLTSSTKFKGAKIPKVEPYTQTVRIDGETGRWNTAPTDEDRREAHARRVELVKEAGKRYRAAREQ